MSKSLLHLSLCLAALLASGCYCPMLSGRYGEAACPPFCTPNLPAACCEPQPAPLIDGDAACCPPGRRGCSLLGLGGRLGDGHGGGKSGPVPSQQGPDYVSPLPKFHPVPTRPVFEPELVPVAVKQ